MSTPDENVAARIIEKFREAGIISETGIKKLYPNLVAGKLKAEDWKFIFETYRADAEDGNAPQD